MSIQSVRQSELFAGNDWTVIYKAFTNVNLNAFDFNSIRQSMVTYINQNYPEMFNDWINSDEYVALIDIVAYLGEAMAFRMDLNARENFLELASRRESVLRMARFLSYRPKRNLPATGKMKLVGISTNDTVYDSLGNNLSNTKVSWNDTANINWYEQFIIILNNALIQSNPFGTYLDTAEIGGINSQIYRFNNIISNSGVFDFSENINGTSVPFEIISSKFNDSKTAIQEVEPDLVTPFQILYMDDNNGNASNKTGFFCSFKQGSLSNYDVSITSPSENMTIDVGVNNINDTDLWVQTVNDAGYITTNGKWNRVGYVPTVDTSKIILTSDNITYNNFQKQIRNLYQDITLTNDQIRLRFGDGRFSSIPTGNLRIWYRTSINDNLIINPSDMDDVAVTINYTNPNGNIRTATLYFSLQETVSNGAPSETTDQIKQRASSVYSTQGRMVSGNDYNVFPMSNQNVLKSKAINRMYSGQSKYLDLNDPTGSYQSTNIYCDDGAIYKYYENAYTEITSSTSISSNQITEEYIANNFADSNMQNFLYDYIISSGNGTVSLTNVNWIQSESNEYSGFFNVGQNSNITASQLISYCSAGMFLSYKDKNNIQKWIQIVSYDSTNVNNNVWNQLDDDGPLVTDYVIPDGTIIDIVIPAIKSSLSTSDINLISNNITNKQTFGIGYDVIKSEIYIIPFSRISDDAYSVSTKGTLNDSSWIIKCEYSPLSWRIYTRNLFYIFESVDETKFFFINTYETLDRKTGKVNKDQIKILKYNFPNSISEDITFNIKDTFAYYDGYVEPRRVIISNTQNNSVSPSYFYDVVNNTEYNFVFHAPATDANGYNYFVIDTDVTVLSSNDTIPQTGISYLPSTSDDINGIFYENGIVNENLGYEVNVGTYNLSFMWKHLSPDDNRIDPSVSNLIDIYVLTSGYYSELETWRNNGLNESDIPEAPSQIELETTFADLENYKMFSDSIIWKPAEFLFIGGSSSISDYNFTLKIVPLPGSTISNSEIKTRCLEAVNTFFNIDSWDFGEKFYASELIAFIHQQLINCISSVVVVPVDANQSFGDLFEIDAESNQLFFSTLTINDIAIIPALTNTSLRIGNGN